MIDVKLVRTAHGDQGTFGRLTAAGLVLFSGELPWRGSVVGRSCIPEGAYPCVWGWSPHLSRMCYHVTGVPGRAGILIHSANLVGDTALGWIAQVQGCIALGLALGYFGKQRALLTSITAVRRFNEFMQQKPFQLEVQDHG